MFQCISSENVDFSFVLLSDLLVIKQVLPAVVAETNTFDRSS